MLRLAVILLVAGGLGACDSAANGSIGAMPGADAGHGKRVIAAAGCGHCHEIPGVRGAHGMVGPPLERLGRRTMLAGYFPNTPTNLVHWIEAPQRFLPGNAMPNAEIDDDDARDVAAYLYSLR